MKTKNITTLLWKEIKEITRDKKLILTTIFLPLISLPLISILTSLLLLYQPVVISIIIEDPDLQFSNYNWIPSILERELGNRGHRIVYGDSREKAFTDVNIDIILIIPQGFTHNLTQWNTVAYLEIVRRTGVSEERLNMAENDIRSIANSISSSISREKINRLCMELGLVQCDPSVIRDPIIVGRPVFIVPTGEKAKEEDVIRPFIARLLILSFTFIVTPASSYIVDGIVGERERKTMEMLIASPVGLWDLFVSKTIAASLIGLVASIADIVALLGYFGLLISILGGWFMVYFDVKLILLHALIAFLTILVTVSISLPFISRVKGIKTASNITGLLSIIGLAFFVSGWIIDFYKLPSSLVTSLLFVPYTHSILAIQSYIYRDYNMVMVNIGILILLSLIILFISLKTLNREKIILAS